MWRLHVESGVAYGLALWDLPETGIVALDRAQREAARALLGFANRSPTPAMLVEPGWVPWSKRSLVFKARLLRRLLNNENSVVREVAAASAQQAGGWVERAQAMLSSFW